MSRVKKGILLIITFTTCVYVSKACSCIGKDNTLVNFKKAICIFSGKVISLKQFEVIDTNIYFGMHIFKNEYTFIVQKTYKGFLYSDTVRVITGVGKGDCGYAFKINKSYLVYTTVERKLFQNGDILPEFLHTDICAGTKRITRKGIKELKKMGSR